MTTCAFSIRFSLTYTPRNSTPNAYCNYEQELCTRGLSFPLELGNISKFERMNPTISVNVFGLNNENVVVPLRISNMRDCLHEVDLLLLTDGDKMHYTLIRNMSRLLNNRTRNGHRVNICRHCLHRFSTLERLKRHIDRCSEHRSMRSLKCTAI